MLFKALVLGLLLYFAYKATRDLFRAMLGLPPGNQARSVQPPPAPTWKKPTRSRRSAESDIEDARWEDLD
jgi:hypothetical protein